MRNIDGYDVIVVGSGPGGFASAVGAARAGARTLLLEREGCLGGGMTTMLVHPFMTHRTQQDATTPFKTVNAGLYTEVCQRIFSRKAGKDGWCVHFNDEVMKLVLDELCEEAGVKVVFHAALFDAEVEGGWVKAARFSHNGGPLRVGGRVFIDGTGDGLLAAQAGAEFMFGDSAGKVMPMTLNFLVGGVDIEKMPAWDKIRDICRAGDKDAPPLINTNFSCWSWDVYPNAVHFNAIRVGGNTIDPFDISAAEAEARRRLDNYIQWLRARVPGFEKCYLMKTGAHIGVRESRRVVGDYVLDESAFFKATHFDDGIAACAYDVDIHGPTPNSGRIEHMKPGQFYTIPYRCLTPKGLHNLLVAGRGISADRVMHSSLRVMPPLINVGEAAGRAAAMSLPAGDVRKIDVQALREAIRSAGGIC